MAGHLPGLCALPAIVLASSILVPDTVEARMA